MVVYRIIESKINQSVESKINASINHQTQIHLAPGAVPLERGGTQQQNVDAFARPARTKNRSHLGSNSVHAFLFPWGRKPKYIQAITPYL